MYVYCYVCNRYDPLHHITCVWFLFASEFHRKLIVLSESVCLQSCLMDIDLLRFFFLVVIVVVNYFSEMFRYITGNSKCAIQTFVYKPLYVLTLRQDKGRGIRRYNPSTAIILLCLPIENFGLSFHKTPEIEYRNVTKII